MKIKKPRYRWYEYHCSKNNCMGMGAGVIFRVYVMSWENQLYVGHGEPLEGEAVQKFLESPLSCPFCQSLTDPMIADFPYNLKEPIFLSGMP